MSNIVVKYIASDKVRDEHNHVYLERAFSIDGKEVTGNVDYQSLNPLRFLEDALVKKGIKIRKLVEGNDVWNIKELEIESQQYKEIENLLNEIMEYRCHPEFDLHWEQIIYQLPYDVLMRTSDNIMNYGKKAEEHFADLKISKRSWARAYDEVRYMCGYEQAQKYLSDNPSGIVDNYIISKDEPEKRKHLIYKSSHGGYNIKTRGYQDSSLAHYSFWDSNSWD